MGGSELGFEKDIAVIVSKLLTAKAVQHILTQLGQTDKLACQWFNNFVSDNPPMQGDDFVLKLMRQVGPQAKLMPTPSRGNSVINIMHLGPLP